MKRPFVAIVGGRNAGKSTIIKSLTGCPSGQFRGSVTDNSTGRTVEVIASSPQEIPLSLAKLRTILKRAVASPNCNGVVCALQPNRPRTRLSMEDVLDEAIAYGFKVFVYVLDPGHDGRVWSLATLAARIPSGASAPVILDARSFCIKNATAINVATRIAS